MAVAVNVLDVAVNVLDVDEPPIDLGMDSPRINTGDGIAISKAWQRMDEKWNTILETFNDNLEQKHAYDVEQRRNDEENRDEQRWRDREEQRLNEDNRDEQRRRDRKEQCLINAELRTVKRLDFEALLVSSKEAFATEMKATFDGFRSELSSWKTSINDSMATNTTTLQAEIKAAIDTPAAISLKATVDGLMVTVPTFMQEVRATVSALSDTVKSLEDRVIRSQGQFKKTTLPELRSRLDLLEGRTTQVPKVLVEEPPPAHPPESTVLPPPAVSPVVSDMRTSTQHPVLPVVSDMRTSTHHPVLPESQMVSEMRTSTHHSVLPVVLPLDPPDDLVAPPPRVPPEHVHQPTPQSHLASPGFNTGNPGPHAPMADTPDPLINSRAAYAALRARMSHEATSEDVRHTDGTRLSCGATHAPDARSPTAPSTRVPSGRHVTPPSQPSNRYRQPTICESLFRGGVDIDGDGDGSLGCNDNHHSHTTFDFGRDGDHQNANGNVPIMGGPIISPRHSDRAMHARTLGASRFDVMKLASAEYHYGMDGVDDLNEKFIQDCGYGIVKATVEDVVVCFNDIIMVHRKVRDLWHNNYAHTLGPQVSTILTKHIKVFPKLDSLVIEDVVAFYDRLQEVGSNYLIALMPFDAIVLSNRFEGLCPPGLGLLRYAAMSKALLELLPWLIPTILSPQVGAALASVRYDTGNGYDFLWRVLELTVPGFDPTTSIQAPIWSETLDIFSFAQEYLLFFRLQAKQNFHYNDRTRSGLFLRVVQSSQFADTITLLQSHINSYREEFEDGYLPPNLLLHGLATSLNQNAQSHLCDIATPRARRLEGNTTLTNGATSPHVQGVPSIYRFECPHPGFGDREHRRDNGDRPRRREDSDRNKTVRFPRRTVHLPVRARVVAASNMGQAGWLVPIATVVPS